MLNQKNSTPPETTNARRWVMLTGVAMVLLALYLACHAGRRALNSEVSDFQAYYTAAAEMRADRDPYEPSERPYLYPPLLACLLMPLTLLPIQWAALTYLPFLVAAILLSLRLASCTMLDRLEAKPNTAVLSQVILITTGLMFDRMKADTQMFQVNTLMLLMLSLGLYWLDRKPWLAGSALGLALNIKGQSFLVLPYLLLRRRWSVATAMIAAAVGFALLPAAAIGWNANLTNLGRFFGGLRALTTAHGSRNSTTHLADLVAGPSVSVTSGMARILTGAGHTEWLWPFMGLLVVALFSYTVWAYRQADLPLWRWPDRREQSQQPWRCLIAVEWSCLVMATLIFSPQTNTRHLMLMLLPLTMAVSMLYISIPRRIRWLMLLGVVVLFAGLTLPPGNRRVAWLFAMELRWLSVGGPCWLMLVALGFFIAGGVRAAKIIEGSVRK